MTLHVPDCRCHPVHGNADTDGIDARCRPAIEAAEDARQERLRAALTAFAEQMPGQMWDYAVEATISALVRSLSLDGRCRLCGYHGDCALGCAADQLRELID